MIFLMLSVCGRADTQTVNLCFSSMFSCKYIESKYISYIFSDVESVHISYGCTLIIQFIVHVMSKRFKMFDFFRRKKGVNFIFHDKVKCVIIENNSC